VKKTGDGRESERVSAGLSRRRRTVTWMHAQIDGESIGPRPSIGTRTRYMTVATPLLSLLCWRSIRAPRHYSRWWRPAPRHYYYPAGDPCDGAPPPGPGPGGRRRGHAVNRAAADVLILRAWRSREAGSTE
jgi:hypothetical protein